ncbi:hypothetical protein ACX8XN_02540 [Calditrichota bacterium GD2]
MRITKFLAGVLVILLIYGASSWGFAVILQFNEEKINSLWISGIINTVNVVFAFLIIRFTIDKEAKKFMKTFFTGMGIRILALLAIILFMLQKNYIEQFTFIISFFILYVLYQMWEIWMINSHLRKES